MRIVSKIGLEVFLCCNVGTKDKEASKYLSLNPSFQRYFFFCMFPLVPVVLLLFFFFFKIFYSSTPPCSSAPGVLIVLMMLLNSSRGISKHELKMFIYLVKGPNLVLQM